MLRIGFRILLVAGLLGALALEARGQSVAFRRGDANGDGRFDIADGVFALRVLFKDQLSLCRDAEDVDDNGVRNISDPIRALNFLCSGGPPPDAPALSACGEDPSGDGLDCVSYTACGEPPPLLPDGRFELGFSAPAQVTERAGRMAEFMALVEMCNAEDLEGWSFGIKVEPASTCSLLAVTVSGTSADIADAGGFQTSEMTDPFRNGGTRGAVSTVLLSLKGSQNLPATDSGAGCTNPHPVLNLIVGARAPSNPGECVPCTLEFIEGLVGSGEEVPIRVAVGGQSALPGSLQGATVQVCEGEPPPEFASVLFQLEDSTGFPGGPVTVPFAVKADRPSQGFSYSIDFDEDVLAYESTEKLWERPSGTAYDFERFEVDSGAGFLVGAALISLTDTRDVLPPSVLTEVLAFHMRVSLLAQAGTETALVFTDGGQGTGGPVPNKIIAGGRDVTPSTADSFAFVNGLIGIVGDISAFIRGDSDGNETLNIADPQTTLNYLFLGSRPPVCYDAADSNDDGKLDMSDPIATLQHLFLGTYTLPPPTGSRGPDPTADDMTCSVRGS